MKLPPLLLGATLLFWGWQTGLPTVGAVMAVLLEGARLMRFKWEWSDDEFNRLWNFCSLIFIAASVYAFTANQGPAAISRMVEDPNLLTQRAAGETSQRTAASLLQWLPMVFFPFLIVLVLSGRSTLKLSVFSLIARRLKKLHEPSPLADRQVNPAWIYFGIALLSASINVNDGNGFFAGLSILVIWALWTKRSRRFALPFWAATAVIACALGFWGQHELGGLRQFVEGFTPQWPWRWSGHRISPNESNTSIGQIGGIKSSGRIFIRLEVKDGTPTPPLLRSASYRTYKNQTWSAGNARGDLGAQANLSPVFAEPKSATWVLREANIPEEINIATFLEGQEDVLPLPLGAARLENLPVFALRTNSLGTVVAVGPGVVLYDVRFGPIGSIDSPPTEMDGPDAVPEREAPALEKVISELNLTGQTTNQMLRTISAYFQDHFTYSTWQHTRFNRRTALSPLATFLTETRTGHCEYFATATVLLLRELGIPARYAVGWSVQEKSGKGFVIRERHAHAWCLYYLNGQWHDLDTTPASWVAAENERASPLQFLSDAWSRIKFEFLKWRWGQSNLRDYIWWIVGPMLLFLLWRLVRRKPGQHSRRKAGAEADVLVRLGLDSEFYLVEKKLGEFGFIRPTGETLGQFLERALRDARIAALQDVLLALLRVHYRLRFDPLGLTSQERDTLRHRVRHALEQLTAVQKPV